ncbi:hypothetical protein PHK61_09645 [Actinomycetospora lutea]|uniref:hypothetical protein n=1 Tax=Actinomycetospora lutea TaxID=663604 RepID=UPI002366A0F3|nr:hypothetical protein [Actinomycetospora lutea]MDD7938678.1 hypothetical protein [Actinomycetospora lutea]
MSSPADFDEESAAARIAQNDMRYHQARILLLLDSVCKAEGTGKKLDGLTKLAKLDFLVRYPAMAQRVIPASSSDERLEPSDDERRETESPMIRYKYGPWDDRYYPIIGALVGCGLAAYSKGRAGSVALRMTAQGRRFASELRESQAWSDIALRCDAVAEHVGSWNGNRLKEAVYQNLPEVVALRQR